MKNPRPITVIFDPMDKVETTRGKIPARQWCDEEVARINGKGGHAEVRVFDQGIHKGMFRVYRAGDEVKIDKAEDDSK